MGGSFGWLGFLLSTSHPCEDDAAEELPVEPPVAAIDAAHDGRGEVWVEVPFEPPEVVAGEKEEAVAAMDAAHDGRDEVRGEVPFEPSEVLAGEEAAMDAPHDGRGEVRGEVSFERAKEEAAMDAAHDGRGEVRGEVPSKRANGASSRADYALNDSELGVCRPNFGFVDRPPRHNPKRRHPKNQRDKGINALGKDGKDCSPVKIQKQDDFVTELNNHLVTVYQTSLKIREMIELCEFYADMSNSKRNAILAKMLKNTHCQEDFGVLDLIDQAQKYDKFFANLAVKLKRLLGRLRTAVTNSG